MYLTESAKLKFTRTFKQYLPSYNRERTYGPKLDECSLPRMADVADTELLDYEEEEQTAGGDAAATGDAAAANGTNGAGKLTQHISII